MMAITKRSNNMVAAMVVAMVATMVAAMIVAMVGAMGLLWLLL